MVHFSSLLSGEKKQQSHLDKPLNFLTESHTALEGTDVVHDDHSGIFFCHGNDKCKETWTVYFCLTGCRK